MPFENGDVMSLCILTIPKTGAVDTSQKLVQYGIKAIWNFAHVDLDVPSDVVVENVHLSDSLMKLSYRINCNSCLNQSEE